MARKSKGLKILPALYKKKFDLDELWQIEENKEEWLRIREENRKKLLKK